MTLQEYLTTNKAKVLADQIGRSQSFVSELKNGTRRPSWATMRAIHDATNGVVTFQDWSDAA